MKAQLKGAYALGKTRVEVVFEDSREEFSKVFTRAGWRTTGFLGYTTRKRVVDPEWYRFNPDHFFNA